MSTSSSLSNLPLLSILDSGIIPNRPDEPDLQLQLEPNRGVTFEFSEKGYEPSQVLLKLKNTIDKRQTFKVGRGHFVYFLKP